MNVLINKSIMYNIERKLEWKKLYMGDVVFRQIAKHCINEKKDVIEFMDMLIEMLLTQNETLTTYCKDLQTNNPIKLEINKTNYEAIKKIVEGEKQ